MIIDLFFKDPLQKAHTEPKEKTGFTHSSQKVSVMKAISWRVFASLDTIMIAWFVVGDMKAALSVGFLEVVTKTFLYYFHERAWVRVTRRLKGV